MLLSLSFTGIAIAGFALGLFQIGLGHGLAKAQTMVFSALVVFQIVRLYVVRAQYRVGLFTNGYLWGAVALSLLLQIGAVYVRVPAGSADATNLFGAVPLTAADWGYIVAAALILLVLSLLFMRVLRRLERS